MCTIIALHQIHPEYPVIIAANRDEFYARPSSPPRVLLEEPRAIGGVDGRKGGSWMGVTAQGFFVGLTNQRTWGAADGARRSRGEVVVEALRAGDTHSAEGYLRSLRPADYNPFSLLFGDAGGLKVAYLHEGMQAPEVQAVPPGVHVLPNDRLDAPSFPKVERAQALLKGYARQPWPQLRGRLVEVLADGALPPLERAPVPPPGSLFPRALAHRLEALCIKTPVYGTRSATIAALSPGAVAAYLFADQAPAPGRFEDMTGLLG
jgi:uncharacterized protein with NRDE domain